MRMLMPVAALAALLGGPALAQTSGSPPPGSTQVTHATTVADLAAMCAPRSTGLPRLESIAYCQGYVTAAGHAYAELVPASGPRPQIVCMGTPGPSIAEAGIGFAAWAAQHPEHASEPALDGLLRYARATYPCAAAPRAAR
ncbi:hypothetical protein C8P66_110123 [Humitalea rosea]|uniref:Rap1a immunity protein domain-containing protein n=1 Tax=Humitalea rosea TaxID=990373 RepID=A0A2W7IKV9_9PROT|nr:Rap1a/Tai family immunity protein [Humitalea rosea]PZW45925.1 hypothetical protein C8P66_110123 [Humitalea rosea]